MQCRGESGQLREACESVRRAHCIRAILVDERCLFREPMQHLNCHSVTYLQCFAGCQLSS
jgi:hypothetical protein